MRYSSRKAQIEFLYKAMPSKAKKMREKPRKPVLRLPIRGVSLSREILKERRRSKKGTVLFLERKAKETSGSINPENNRIGGKKVSTGHTS